MRLFCFGYGYVAKTLGRLVSSCVGTSRSAGLPGVYHYDATGPLDEAGRTALRAATHVLVSIPPADGVLQFHAEDMAHVRWLGYLSTTGVYGDHQGDWVDEQSELRTTEPRSLARIKAENEYLAFSAATTVFRLAGIYGPGRNALRQVREGTAKRIDKPGHYFSRIHVDDIARLLLASMENPGSGRIFNLADALPAPSHEVVTEAARLLGATPPPFTPFSQAELSPMGRSFYAANRRVDATRIIRDLGVGLCYPTYKEGLKSLLQAEIANASDR